jgi:putative endonuclease
MSISTSPYNRGLQGESIAVTFLKLHGYQILKTRYRTPYGEVDIIAQSGKMIICVEVKTRSTLTTSLYAIHPRQQERIMSAYLYFIQAYPEYMNASVRFDVIVCAPNVKPLHIQHAFEFNHE